MGLFDYFSKQGKLDKKLANAVSDIVKGKNSWNVVSALNEGGNPKTKAKFHNHSVFVEALHNINYTTGDMSKTIETFVEKGADVHERIAPDNQAIELVLRKPKYFEMIINSPTFSADKLNDSFFDTLKEDMKWERVLVKAKTVEGEQQPVAKTIAILESVGGEKMKNKIREINRDLDMGEQLEVENLKKMDKAYHRNSARVVIKEKKADPARQRTADLVVSARKGKLPVQQDAEDTPDTRRALANKKLKAYYEITPEKTSSLAEVKKRNNSR